MFLFQGDFDRRRHCLDNHILDIIGLVYTRLLFSLFIVKSPVIPVKEGRLLLCKCPLPNDDRQILMNKQKAKAFISMSCKRS